MGGDQCTQPYSAALLNVSAMSFGALSPAAITALNMGASYSNCYHNTGLLLSFFVLIFLIIFMT